jgi:WD40 repeat protein
MGGIESVDYEIVNVEKSPSSALQEPSFSPGSDDLFAYLEVKKNSHDMTSYELLIHSLERQESYHLTDNIYRNEENKTSQPLSTSYAWHPTQNIIYFIDKFSNRSILLADYSDLSNPTIQELSLELEYVENLSVSPDGKYLAAITSSSSFSESEDALNQLHLITLDVK